MEKEYFPNKWIWTNLLFCNTTFAHHCLVPSSQQCLSGAAQNYGSTLSQGLSSKLHITMYKLVIQHCWQPRQLSVSSSPSQLLFAVNQTAAVASLSVLLDLWTNQNNIWYNNLNKTLKGGKGTNLTNSLSTNLQRGTWHSDSLQARAWSWRRYHIFLQRTQPPDARVLHCIPWRKSPFTLRQFGYWQSAERHCEACTSRSSIFLSCNVK